MPFCPNCGFEIEVLNFCPKCGYSLKGPAPTSITKPTEPQETVFYRGEGNMIVKTIKQQGLVTKVGVYLFTGPIGYLIWGRDKKKKVTGLGSLIITNRAIYFAGRKYPFDRIGSLTKQGNSIFVDVDVTKESSYGTAWVDIVRTGITGESCSVELEIQTNDVDKVSNALEQARFSEMPEMPGARRDPETPPVPPPERSRSTADFVKKCINCGREIPSAWEECQYCKASQRS